MVMRSTIADLPDVDALRRKAQSLAVLDAIMSPDWQYRFYSFNSHWGVDEMMASRRTGSGDELYILFNRFGAILKGFDHESLMSPWAREDLSLWPQIFDQIPTEFQPFLKEPAFDIPNTTFCVWRRSDDSLWHMGNVEYPDADAASDGSEEQLALLVGGPELYVEFANEYFERTIPLEIVSLIYRHAALTEATVKQMNPQADIESLNAELPAIGYPSG